jgi:hypothetical protein
MGRLTRRERLQIMLMASELAALDDWRFKKRMPTLSSAVRELLRRGLAAEGFPTATNSTKSKDFGIISPAKHPDQPRKRSRPDRKSRDFS